MTEATTTRSRLGTHHRDIKPFIVKHNYEMTQEIALALIERAARPLAEILDKEEKRRRALAGELHQEWSEGFAYAPQVLAGLPEERIEVNEDDDLDKQVAVTMEKTVTQL